MNNIELSQKNILSPDLDIKKTQKNIISHLRYYSFEERVFDLATLFSSNLCKERTQIIGANVYKDVARHYNSHKHRECHPIYNGVYKLAPLSVYMGFIPEKNQIEIKKRFESLQKNPFLKNKFELTVLAPLNNFAEENNIKAIDPIAFAFYKEDQDTYLITLSQWV